MPKLAVVIPLCVFFAHPCLAQDSSNNNLTTAAASNAVNLYYQYTDKQSRLYTGLGTYDYPAFVQGHPYFMDSAWKNGSVVYDGLSYRNVPMMYDLVKDELVILHYNNVQKLTLLSEKIKEFNLQGHHFVRIEKDTQNKESLPVGFYDRLYNDHSVVLARRTKIIEEKITTVVERFITAHDHYYVQKDGVFHEVHSYGNLIAILKDHAREIKQYLRKNRIRYGKNRENAIIKAVAYYDTLKK
jgi:hypothetical protein